MIDGSKALEAGINRVFGSRTSVQLCRNPKVLNSLGYLLEDREMDVEASMKGAFVLNADESIRKLDKLGEQLDREYPSAACRLRKGLTEMLRINRLDLPKTLRRCLASMNGIESLYSSVREKTRHVKRRHDDLMSLCCAASAAPTNIRCKKESSLLV